MRPHVARRTRRGQDQAGDPVGRGEGGVEGGGAADRAASQPARLGRCRARPGCRAGRCAAGARRWPAGPAVAAPVEPDDPAAGSQRLERAGPHAPVGDAGMAEHDRRSRAGLVVREPDPCRDCCIERSHAILTARSPFSRRGETGTKARRERHHPLRRPPPRAISRPAPEDLSSRSPAMAQCNSAHPARAEDPDAV